MRLTFPTGFGINLLHSAAVPESHVQMQRLMCIAWKEIRQGRGGVRMHKYKSETHCCGENRTMSMGKEKQKAYLLFNWNWCCGAAVNF